jgi:beta-galactosidase
VTGGGVLVLGPRAGSKTPENTTGGMLGPGPLSRLCATVVEEYDAPPPAEAFEVRFTDGQKARGRIWRDVLGARGAEVLARYEGGIFDGLPAVTLARHGAGMVILCGTYGGDELWDCLFNALQGRLPSASGAPADVEVVRRSGGGKSVEFVINHNRESVEYEGRVLAPLEVVVR